MIDSARLRSVAEKIKELCKNALLDDSAFNYEYYRYLISELGEARFDKKSKKRAKAEKKARELEPDDWVTINHNPIPLDENDRAIGGQPKALGIEGDIEKPKSKGVIGDKDRSKINNKEYVKKSLTKAVAKGVTSPIWMEKAVDNFKILPRPFDKINSTGKNTIVNGFSKLNLLDHTSERGATNGVNNHLGQFGGINPEEYNKKAVELLGKEVGGNIYGYMTETGTLVRYNDETGEYVKGHPDLGVVTFFKAGYDEKGNYIGGGYEYFKRWEKKERYKQ